MSTTFLDLAKLPEDMRGEVAALHAAFETIIPPLEPAWKRIAADLGLNWKTVRGKFYAWRARGWRALVNAARCPEFGPARDAGSVSPETYQHFHDLCLLNGRKHAPAWRKLKREFFNSEPIPGVPHGTSRLRLPVGWTRRNFYEHSPTEFETRAARIGVKAAAECRPLVFTTRQGLQVMQYVQFDDMWHDFEVVVLGRRNQRCRLMQLHAHDLFSACQFARGLKPRVRREDETSVGLTEDEMLFLAAHVLGNVGFNDATGSTFMCEAGTAALEKYADTIFNLSGGKVRVHTGEVRAERAFTGQYLGRGKGNFRVRASMESLGNLIHNETSDLLAFPGQTGFNARLNAPEELHGRQKIEDKLLQAIVALPAPIVARLRHSFLEVNQAIWLVESLMDLINRRGSLPWWREHEIEGFAEAQLTTTDYETPLGVFSEADFLRRIAGLPAEQQEAARRLAVLLPRKLSPHEVFEAGRKGLVRFRPEQTALLVWPARRKEPVTVGRDHLVTFEDGNISPEPLRYLAHHFAPGEKFDAVVNPVSPETLFIYDAQGRWLGTLKSWQRIRRDDQAGLERQMGAAAKVRGELLQPLAEAGRDLTRKLIADTEHNNEVLGGDAKRHARELRKFKGDAEELVEAENPGAGIQEPEDNFAAEGLL